MILEFMLSLVTAFGYAGVFLGSFIGSATIFLPLPSFVFVVIAGRLLDPPLVGIVAGFGAALGELVAYGVAAGIALWGMKRRKTKRMQKRIQRERKWYHRFNRFFHKRRWGFVLIIVFALTPLPDDLIALYCGAIRYDIRKFFIATLIGKIVLSIALAYAGYYGWEYIANYFA